ncbi:hypothetical protein IKP85_05905, partial [bacterium]|nr:hypothetical protein [bacterium]
MADEFGINNGGQQERLEKFKHGIRKEQLDDKHKKLFDIFDVNKDGTLEAEETSFIEGIMSATAGEDKIIDDAENQFAASIFASQFGIADADFMGFTKSVSD